MYGSESSIDHSYGRENPRPLSTMGLQNKITEVHNNPQNGSDSNFNYNEGRICEFLESIRLNSSAQVGDQNLSGSRPSAENRYKFRKLDARVGDQNLCGSGPSIGNRYRLSNLDTRVGDQNLYGPGPHIGSMSRRIDLDTRVGAQILFGSGPSIEFYGINDRYTRVGGQNLDGPGPGIGNLIPLDDLNLRARIKTYVGPNLVLQMIMLGSVQDL